MCNEIIFLAMFEMLIKGDNTDLMQATELREVFSILIHSKNTFSYINAGVHK